MDIYYILWDKPEDEMICEEGLDYTSIEIWVRHTLVGPNPCPKLHSFCSINSGPSAWGRFSFGGEKVDGR